MTDQEPVFVTEDGAVLLIADASRADAAERIAAAIAEGMCRVMFAAPSAEKASVARAYSDAIRAAGVMSVAGGE